MKHAKWILTSCATSMLLACSQQSSKTASAGRNNDEKQEFGSATDIVSPENPNQPTNKFNVLDNGQGGPVNRESGNYQSQPAAGQEKDSELAKQIKVALTTGSMGTTGAIAENQLTKIDVQVKDGVVTLTGPVSSEKERQIILKQIGGFKGVRSLEDHLEVGARNVKDIPLQPLVPRPGNQ